VPQLYETGHGAYAVNSKGGEIDGICLHRDLNLHHGSTRRGGFANLLEEEVVLAGLTPSAIAIARRPTLVGHDSCTNRRAVRCRHFLRLPVFQSLAFHLHANPPNDIPAIVVCAF